MTEVDLQAWVGRSQTVTDLIHPVPAAALAATLDGLGTPTPGPGDALPPLWVWLYFLPIVPMAEVGPDGHPRRGGFLPPVALERRMWAGGRLRFHGALRLGAEAERVSTIFKIAEKVGATGPMVFVTLRHEIRQAGSLVIEEEQDIVYLPLPDRFAPPPAQPAPPGDWVRPFAIDPVLLFRFSALTLNGHRIHYDRPYAMEVEKYPGLVVHGPLQAILLFEAARQSGPQRAAAGFSFRAMRPLFDFDAVALRGRAGEAGLELFTTNGDGAIGMRAEVTWLDPGAERGAERT